MNGVLMNWLIMKMIKILYMLIQLIIVKVILLTTDQIYGKQFTKKIVCSTEFNQIILISMNNVQRFHFFIKQ